MFARNPSSALMHGTFSGVSIRMSCLRSAVEVLSGYGSELEERIEKTLEVSRRFERYVLNGE